MQKNLGQYGNTVGLEFDLDEFIAELAVRGTCRRELATRGTRQIFYLLIKKIDELPFNPNFKLKFSCPTRDESNIVYYKIINNCILANE